MKKNILFVSHDASRTGAPIVLGHLMRWLKDNGGINFSILLKKGGDLEDDLRTLGAVYEWSPELVHESLWNRVNAKISYTLFNKPLYKKYPRQLKNKPFDLLYLNTVATTSMLPVLKAQHKCPVILHVHENEFSIKAVYPDSLNSDYLKLIDHYIVVSESTRLNLVKNFGIAAEKISVVNDFVAVKNIPQVITPAEQIKAQLKSNDRFIIGGAGITSWRKGTDIFVQLASIVTGQLKGKVKFVWVGEIKSLFKCQLEYELNRIGLSEDDIIFTGSVKNPFDYFRAFDVFVLPSREDPFPLVCLEAAAFAKPIICFDKSGGMADFLKTGGGLVVPYGDVAAMAAAVIGLYNDPVKLNALGEEARTGVQQYDVAVQAPAILDLINAR